MLVATKNRHKLEEIKKILKEEDIIGMDSVTDIDIEETGETFEENALIKARALREICKDRIIIADDSGLEIDALNKRPGIYSARYAGENATDQERIDKILEELKSHKNRCARFVCVIAVIFKDGTEKIIRGECEGEISGEARGENGFGYDPIFYLREFDKTMAEIPSDLKNKISHRAKAFEKLKNII